MTDRQKTIINLLTEGLNERQISRHLELKGYTRTSLSLIEKEINKLKKQYRARTLFQLAVKIYKT